MKRDVRDNCHAGLDGRIKIFVYKSKKYPIAANTLSGRGKDMAYGSRPIGAWP